MRKKFSTATHKTGACPHCGSTAFKAKRSVKGKTASALTLGAGLLAPKSQVKCIGCGKMYKRG